MVTVLRLAALMVLFGGAVTAIELWPAQGTVGLVLDCVLQGPSALGIAPAAPGAPDSAPAPCAALLPSLSMGLWTLLGAVLIGGFASLLHHMSRLRHVLERLAGAQIG